MNEVERERKRTRLGNDLQEENDQTDRKLTFGFIIIFGFIRSCSDVLAQNSIVVAVVGHAVSQTIFHDVQYFGVHFPV